MRVPKLAFGISNVANIVVDLLFINYCRIYIEELQ